MQAISVLLVDDEQAYVEALKKRLAKRGLSVTGVYSGRQALDYLKNNSKVDVVILDVKMPEMDGLETLKAIKKDYPLLEVVMLTGHATVESAIEGMKLGAFDYLMKITEIDDIIAKIDQAASKKKKHELKILEAKALSIADRRGD